MGTSGGTTTVAPTTFRIAVPTMPLLIVGTTDIPITWDDPMPNASYSTSLNQRALLGKGVAQILDPVTPAGLTIRVTATALVAAGAQLYILAWA